MLVLLHAMVEWSTGAAGSKQTNHMKQLITTISTLAFATSLSLAQNKPSDPGMPQPQPPMPAQPPQPEDFFKKLDTNTDGSLSLDEFKAGVPDNLDPAVTGNTFKNLDQNGDGKVTLEEFMPPRPPVGTGKSVVPADPDKPQFKKK